MRRTNKAVMGAAAVLLGGALSIGLTTAEPSPNTDALYVSSNGMANIGDVTRFSPDFEQEKRFDAGNNEGIELDRLGNLFQAGDVVSPTGTLRVISQIRNRGDDTAYDINRDREIGGDQTTLVAPKGFAIAQTKGYVIVADNGDSTLKVFGTSAGGNVAPVATTPLPAKPWDAAYDEATDRLFVALVNGDVVVFDAYLGDGTAIGEDGIARTITPSAVGSIKISTNLHGIAYDRARDALVVSDVGAATAAQSPSFNADGRIFVLPNASTADGMVMPSRSIGGPATLLGNPVDLILDGTDALVAEKAKDRLLRFSDIFDGASGDIAPDQAVENIKPESLATEDLPRPLRPDITDIEEPGQVLTGIATTSNPPVADEFVSRITANLWSLDTTFDTSDGAPSVENIIFDQNGDAYITFDDGLATNAAGGIMVVNRLAKSRDGETYTTGRDRVITGDQTGLVSPKGIEIADRLGLMMVAENGPNAAILVFSTQANGNVEPVFRTTDLGGRKPWDVDYDPASDRLYVAATDGTVLVYDQYRETRGAGGPDRVLTPTDGGAKISVNLHGIIHVAESDTLLLSDVGNAMDATDGQLFVLGNASTASGNVAVGARVGGPDTQLGNPVDITFDGAHVYVAEKSNNLVLRYDNILNRSGTVTAAAERSFERNKPESVALIPEFLARDPQQASKTYLPLVFK